MDDGSPDLRASSKSVSVVTGSGRNSNWMITNFANIKKCFEKQEELMYNGAETAMAVVLKRLYVTN